jgi:ammonium transporter Rh
MKFLRLFKVVILAMLLPSFYGIFAQEPNISNTMTSVLDVQKFERAIHIMAMLILGFGFLMVFVKRYGRSALTATFLLVSIAVPLYFSLSNLGILDINATTIEKLILAEFAAASLLITAGAVLGRLKMHQYLVLGILFVAAYMMNEAIVINGATSLIPKGSFADTGGSIVIHAFGAIFGISAAFFLTHKEDMAITIESDANSDRYSMLGSMVLWVFWPSFCSALVKPELIPTTVINVIMALCASTIATYSMSIIKRGKISIADIANASLAGGVAIGSTCDHASPQEALVIGLLAGVISTLGFAVIQSRMQKSCRLVDTCGVSNLHGLPGLLGGFSAIFIVSGINPVYQLSGIGVTIIIAAAAGMISGKIVDLFGANKLPYRDESEFLEAEY